MNFLAHFHLAWPESGLIIGGLEGDYCKGPLRGALPAEIERGVKLHRAIDAFTDSHPVTTQLRRELPPSLRRYAGIVVDLSFDHFLCLHWSLFSDIPLRTFSTAVYTVLRKHDAALSSEAHQMAARLIKHDILCLYLRWHTVTESAQRIGQRFNRHNPFLNLDAELVGKKTVIEKAFLRFYPDLQSFCVAWREGA
ncbi:MAG: DUF479 domain-containing protein [Halioglobus sp.]|nr:DUF479 domain-containing protein [Halioglobus sp.]